MDSIDLEDERSVELRFLKHVLGVASNLNHSSSRFLLLLKDIEAELPSQLLTYLPPPLSAQFSSSTTFNTSEYHSIYREIKDLIESQLGDATKRFLLNAEGLVGPPSGISTQLTELIKLKGEACESLPKHWALNALMYGILTVGSCEIKYFSQTISNTLSLVDINEHVLKWLISPPSSLEEPQPDETLMNTYNVVLDSVASVWGGSPFVFEVVTTSLMRRGLIPPDKVIKWISSSKTPVLVDFNHMSIILIATAINHVPSLFDRGLSSGAAEYLGDCVVAALDPLLVQASEKQRLVDASEEDDEDDDAALDLKELVDKVRCVVRQGISVRSPTSQRLLNIDTSASVVTRVVKDDTPQAVKDVLSTLNISLY
jgi:hypothetical protein